MSTGADDCCQEPTIDEFCSNGGVVSPQDCDCDWCDMWRRGVAEGRRLERAAIVADLRAFADGLNESTQALFRVAADRYERGEHEEGKR